MINQMMQVNKNYYRPLKYDNGFLNSNEVAF